MNLKIILLILFLIVIWFSTKTSENYRTLGAINPKFKTILINNGTASPEMCYDYQLVHDTPGMSQYCNSVGIPTY
jgi:hypothetical protein